MLHVNILFLVSSVCKAGEPYIARHCINCKLCPVTLNGHYWTATFIYSVIAFMYMCMCFLYTCYVSKNYRAALQWWIAMAGNKNKSLLGWQSQREEQSLVLVGGYKW